MRKIKKSKNKKIRKIKKSKKNKSENIINIYYYENRTIDCNYNYIFYCEYIL